MRSHKGGRPPLWGTPPLATHGDQSPTWSHGSAKPSHPCDEASFTRGAGPPFGEPPASPRPETNNPHGVMARRSRAIPATRLVRYLKDRVIRRDPAQLRLR